MGIDYRIGLSRTESGKLRVTLDVDTTRDGDWHSAETLGEVANYEDAKALVASLHEKGEYPFGGPPGGYWGGLGMTPEYQVRG